MNYLSVPLPLALVLRRIFNLFSSLAVSNQYLTARRNAEARKDEVEMKVPMLTDRLDARFADRLAVAAASRLRDTDSAHGPASLLHRLLGQVKPLAFSKDWHVRHTHSIQVEEVDENGFVNDDSDGPTDQPQSSPPPHEEDSQEPDLDEQSLSPVYELMLYPTLFDPIRKPRNPIVLCHGLYGYDVRGPSAFPMLQLHYWANVLKILKKKMGADVIVTGVPGTGSIESRSESLDRFLKDKARGKEINLLAHSMGGLDCRHLISHVKPKEYRPASLLTISTPHRGSPFMDWCSNNLGIGKLKEGAKEMAMQESGKLNAPSAFALSNLPSSLTTLMLSILDSPAYANLSTHYLEHIFNPKTPDDPHVRYYSVAARTSSISIWHPLWLPKVVLDKSEEQERELLRNRFESKDCSASVRAAAKARHDDMDEWGNDGLVSVRSARWGEFLGTLEGCDHWDVRGGSGVDLPNNLLPSLPNSLSDPFDRLPETWKRLFSTRGKAYERKVGTDNVDKHNRGQMQERVKKLSRQSEDEGKEQDAVVKSSTDKLSAVFDWLSDQAPMNTDSILSRTKSRSAPGATAKATANVVSANGHKREQRAKKREQKAKDPRKEFDLERFYVGLTRKLYDDGF